MIANVCLYMIEDICSVMVNPYVQLLRCKTYVLFFTLFAGDNINYVHVKLP